MRNALASFESMCFASVTSGVRLGAPADTCVGVLLVKTLQYHMSTQKPHQHIRCAPFYRSSMRCRETAPRADSQSIVLLYTACVRQHLDCGSVNMQVDSTPWESLSAEDRATIEAMGAEAAKLSSGGEPRV
jgi:hypothetical protein